MNFKTLWKLLVVLIPLIMDFLENDCEDVPATPRPKPKKVKPVVENIPAA